MASMPFHRDDMGTGNRELRVLLVERNEDDYLRTRSLLSEIATSRFDLEWVTTYESALSALKSDRHDVCLLDYRLGERSGLELLQEINGVVSRAPVIVICEHGNYEMDREAMQAGAADYLVKGDLSSDLLERSLRYAINRKNSEGALRESEARYRGIVEDQAELICRFTPEGSISFVNHACCRCLGRKPEGLLGRGFMSVVPDAERSNLESLLASLSPEHPMKTGEYRVVCHTGEIQWQQWTFRKIFDNAGRLVEYQAVGRDITKRKNMEEALQKSAESIKTFAYSVSHDLKSPLVGIHGLARLLQKQYRSLLDERGKKYCDQIVRATEQLAFLVDEINAFIRAKETPLMVEEVSLRELVQTLQEEFAPRLECRNVSLSGPEADATVLVDRLSILRVLRNLADNALKHGGEILSKITIGYEDSGETFILSVSDDGVGIRSEDRERIFGAYQRNIASKGVPGLGLGLAIVREIAKRHHGRVWVEAGTPQGTKFCIAIPKNPKSPDSRLLPQEYHPASLKA